MSGECNGSRRIGEGLSVQPEKFCRVVNFLRSQSASTIKEWLVPAAS